MSETKEKCQCSLCSGHRRVQAIITGGTIDELRAIANELEERWANTDDSLNYCNALIDGSWPDAASIIQTRGGDSEVCQKQIAIAAAERGVIAAAEAWRPLSNVMTNTALIEAVDALRKARKA